MLLKIDKQILFFVGCCLFMLASAETCMKFNTYSVYTFNREAHIEKFTN